MFEKGDQFTVKLRPNLRIEHIASRRELGTARLESFFKINWNVPNLESCEAALEATKSRHLLRCSRGRVI